jgi:hypothetical protein
VAGPFVALNFGLVEIDWEATPSPLITMKVIGVDGGLAVGQAVSLAALRAGS